MLVFQEHRISQLDDLFHSSLEFIWLLPSDEQLLSVLKLEKDAYKVIQETIKKLTLIDSAGFNFDSVKEVLFCFIKEHKMKTKKYMGVMRSCLGGAKVSRINLFVPPTLKQLKGHIALGLYVRPSICASVTKITLQF